MPFGQAGVEPTLIVSETVPSSWDWCWLGVEEWAGLGQGPRLDSPLHSTPSPILSFRRAWELLDGKVIG